MAMFDVVASTAHSHDFTSDGQKLYTRTIRFRIIEESRGEVRLDRLLVSFEDEFFFSDLEAMLLLLPFDYVHRLLTLLIEYLDRQQSVELCVKCAVFLIKFVTFFY